MNAPLVDLGCQNASFADGFAGMGGVLTLLLTLILIGTLIGGKKRAKAFDFATGWGVFSGLAVMLCAARGLSLAGLLIGMTGLATLRLILGAMKTPKSFFSSRLIFGLAAGALVLPLINRAGITGWDDFSHWVPNALFLARHDAFPKAADLVYSVWPAYPPAMPIIGFGASVFAGAFIVQAGAMMTWLFLCGFAVALAEERPLFAKSFFASFIVSLLFATLANPGFNASFSIMSASDAPTMVALGLAGLLLARVFPKLNDLNLPWSEGFQLAALFIAMLTLRQMNFVLAIFALGGFWIAATREGKGTRALLFALCTLAPALAVRGAWEVYTIETLQKAAFAARDLREWNWPLLPALLRAMGEEMLRKNGLFLLIFGVTGISVWAFFKETGVRRAAFVCAGATNIGLFAFLIAAYMGGSAFSETEITRAASFYRFCSHVALLNLIPLFVWVHTNELPLAFPPRKTAFAALALFAGVIAFKPAWIAMPSRPELCARRDMGQKLAEKLPEKTALCFIDLDDNGMGHFVVNASLALDDFARRNETHIVASADETTSREALDQMKEQNICSLFFIVPSKDPAKADLLRSVFPKLPQTIAPEGFLGAL